MQCGPRDRTKHALAGGVEAYEALPAIERGPLLQAANEAAFHTLAGFVAILIVVFGGVALFERRRAA